MGPRRVNLALLVALAVAFTTGWLAFAFGGMESRWSLAVHASCGFAVLALLPWKQVVVRRGLRRSRPGRWAALTLAALLLVSLAGGLLHATGLWRWWGQLTAMEMHVGAALIAVPLAIWHVAVRRRVTPLAPRAADLSRRHLLRYGAVLATAGASYAASELAVRAAGLPGAARRFTGSYEVGSFQPEMMPVSSWMFDAVPEIDAERWRLRVVTPGGTQEWTHADLLQFDDHLRAALDCTGGFWSEQDWSGVFLARLVPSPAGTASVRVVSHTGYGRRFPVAELPRLLLATRVGGRQLSRAHGFPARLVAPDRRGFWWVKWLTVVEVDGLPEWWQPPFPLQ